MIKNECISKEWIEKVAKVRKADKILVEKVIRALILLEGLAESELNFTFRGGTALLLMLEESKRLSIDIDIIIEDKTLDLSNFINSIVQQKGFIRFEKQERKANTKIDKEHYKLFFQSVIDEKESSILLDVPLKYFLGDNENAIKIQIYCALIANLLLTVVQKRLKRKWSFSNLVSFCKIHLFNYLHLLRFLENPERDWRKIEDNLVKITLF